MGIHVEWTINFGNILTIGGGIIAFVVMFQRVSIILEQVVKDVASLKLDTREHHDWLIRLRTKAGDFGRGRHHDDEE